MSILDPHPERGRANTSPDQRPTRGSDEQGDESPARRFPTPLRRRVHFGALALICASGTMILAGGALGAASEPAAQARTGVQEGHDRGWLEQARDARTGKPMSSASEVRAVFDKNCVKCHGAGRTSAGLNLTGPPSGLVGKPSSQAAGQLIVVSGNPDASYLYLKVTDRHRDVGEGARMPLGGELEASERAQLRDWIAAGAP